jgi:hypothetical protein
LSASALRGHGCVVVSMPAAALRETLAQRRYHW